MKAMVWTEYGPPEVLQLQEVAAPTPGDIEVLVKIHATSVTAGDCELRGLKLPLWLFLLLRTYAGWRRPRRITILGQELAGAPDPPALDQPDQPQARCLLGGAHRA